MTNGDDIFFWETDAAAERHIAGFFSRNNLERLLFLKQNRLSLSSVQIKSSIIDRAYQAEAIRRISEAIEVRKKRKALLVMATGTGKTRTIMALIDVFLRARTAQKVLFLADRDALVDQALTDGFKVHLPNESRTRIRTYNIDKTVRVYVSTLQTLEICYDQFTPADFDLIISDECHRSIYNKYTDVLAYFDAIQIGLTATPAQYIDRDTFKFFDCDGITPTYLYTYEQAVNDKYLADYSVYAAQTKFQRKGIKGVDLTEEEKETLRARGIDPDEINYEGTDLERKITNQDTLRRQWEEFMDVCYKDSTGQLPGKTIIFAITHNHAMRLSETFNEMYPEHQGKLVQVIDSKMERCGFSFLQHRELKQHIESIREDVSLLPSTIKDVEAQQKLINDIISNEFWSNISLNKIDDAKETLAPLMKYRRERPSLVIELGLDDIIDSRKWVILRKDSRKLYVEEYRKKVEEKIEQIVKKHPTIQRLKGGESVDIADLIKLEETLEKELSTDEISLDEENMLKAFGIRVGNFVDFLKHVLNIETMPTYETIVRKAFDAFILGHNYNADQSRFLRAVQNVFIQRRKLEFADLYEEPFTNFGTNAVEKLFSDKEINELIELTNKLTA